MPLPTIQFYFDVSSPYAYVGFHALPKALEGLAYQVQYCPVALGGILKAHNAPAPIQFEHKRNWIKRHTQWLAEQMGLPYTMPAAHPFNSVTWLRMALASNPHGQPSRAVVEQIFAAIWQTGRNPDDADWQQANWHTISHNLPDVRNPTSPEVKAELFALGDEALQRGVFAVPTMVLLANGEQPQQLFWGVDALPMLRAAVEQQQP